MDKDQIIAVHAQVNSIEQQLRETKTEVRFSARSKKTSSAQPAPSSNRDGS
jgi:hypothetical protein